MTDKKFELLLTELTILNIKYKDALEIVEDEIKRRYGKFPSEIDNDEWIDSYHVGKGKMTLKQLDKSMKR